MVGKLYSRVINNNLLKHIELNHMFHEGQGGFQLGRSCIDNIFSLNELIQGSIKRVNSLMPFFYVLRRLTTLYGGMGYGTNGGKSVLKVKCGE